MTLTLMTIKLIVNLLFLIFLCVLFFPIPGTKKFRSKYGPYQDLYLGMFFSVKSFTNFMSQSPGLGIVFFIIATVCFLEYQALRYLVSSGDVKLPKE